MSNSPQKSTHDAAEPSSPARTATYADTESEFGMSPQREAQEYDESQTSSAEEDLETVLRRHDKDALINVIKKLMSEHFDLASTVHRMRELYMANERNSRNFLTQLEFAETACRIVDSLTDQMFASAGGSIDSTDSTDSTRGERSVDDGVGSRDGANKRRRD